MGVYKVYLGFLCFVLYTSLSHGSLNKTKDSLAENVILIIADDLGLEYLEDFRFAFDNISITKYPQTPVISELAKQGIMFPNFYTYPTCSPTRVSILTGRYGFRTGVGCPAGVGDGPGIEENEMTIPKALREYDINSGIFGKWHMSLYEDGYDMPLRMGFNTYRGLFQGLVDSYYLWELSENGSGPVNTTRYATQLMTDHAIEFLHANQTRPFFLWMAYIVPHFPLHKPPADIIYTEEYKNLPEYDPDDEDMDPVPYYYALVESLDSEIGRLLDALTDEIRNKTTIIFISDNGTSEEILEADDGNPYPSDHGKETVYEGGTRMPLIISGSGVNDPYRVNLDLVSSVDIYSTIAEIFGIDVEEQGLWDIILEGLKISEKNYMDSISLGACMQDKMAIHDRDIVISEQFGNCKTDEIDLQEMRAIRNFHKFKYVIDLEQGGEELFYLEDDPYELDSLLTSDGTVKDIADKDFEEYVKKNLEELKETLEDLLESESDEEEE